MIVRTTKLPPFNRRFSGDAGKVRTAAAARDREQLRVARPLRIALYLQDLRGGGVERATVDIVPHFLALGSQVTVLLHQRRGELLGSLPAGVPVVAFETSRTSFDLLPLARWLRCERPDVLLASLHHNNVTAMLAAALSRTRTRVVVCQHNALSHEAALMGSWKYRVLPLLYRLMRPLAAGMVAVSRGVANDTAARCGIRRERIAVIHNPVITADFEARAQAPVDHPWLRQREVPVFIAVGRLVPQKDHETLLHAFARLAARRDARLILLGQGPLEGVLRRLARELGVDDRVELAGFQANPLPWVRQATALVLPSRYEGFGNVIVEALGCGTPVISTDCEFGPAEILGDGEFGALVPVGDAEALAQAMAQDLRARWPADVLKARARQFDAASSARRYMWLFRTLLR